MAILHPEIDLDGLNIEELDFSEQVKPMHQVFTACLLDNGRK